MACPGSVPCFFLKVGSGPHLFDVVELPDFGAEHMDDDVTTVNQHPVSRFETFNAGCSQAFVLEV